MRILLQGLWQGRNVRDVQEYELLGELEWAIKWASPGTEELVVF